MKPLLLFIIILPFFFHILKKKKKKTRQVLFAIGAFAETPRRYESIGANLALAYLTRDCVEADVSVFYFFVCVYVCAPSSSVILVVVVVALQPTGA